MIARGWRGQAAVALAALALLSASAAEEHAHGAHPDAPGAAVLPDTSVYQIEGRWTDQRGERVALSSLRGWPTLVLLFYGTCEHACPILVHRLQELEAGLDPAARASTRFLLVTFDPERDTPTRLAAFAREKQLDPVRWTLLHGAPEQVRELAGVLGVRYRPTVDREFHHTMRITLLDREGRVIAWLDGLDTSLGPLASRLAEQAARPAGQ